MPFANPLMLIGVSAILIPIIIHLLNRRQASNIDWGAMQFLLGSVVSRNRRMLLEETLLLALRCLLLALLALAMGLPFVPPGSTVPWQFVLPIVLLGVVALGAATAMWSSRRMRYGLYVAGIVLLLVGGGLIMAERWFQRSIWGRAAGEQDVAILIDGSASMTVMAGGKSNFERSIDEARTVINSLGAADAVSIIEAGARPLIKTSSPIARRDLLLGILGRLRPTGDSMNLTDALNAAVITLAEGQNASKKIVLITDAQKAGGRTDWSVVAETFNDLPSKPRLIIRVLPMPEKFRNVRVSDLKISREIIGPDRDATIHVRVENTGTEAISSPFDMELRIDGGDPVRRVPITQLNADTAEPVAFRYRFDRGGMHTIEVRAVIEDDLASDNAAATMLRTLDRLPVLVIDGNPAPQALKRASAFVDLALAPETEEDTAVGDDDIDPDIGEEAHRPLIDVTVVDAPEANKVRSFADYRVVILADVPRLPASVALRLAQFVSNGGGLLIAAGERCVPEFYREWRTPHGAIVAPALLVKRQVMRRGERAPTPALSTFQQRIFSVIAESSMKSAAFTAYWQVETDPNDVAVSVCASLDTSDPMVIERRLSKGRILMTSVSLDSHGSNFPTLKAFLPFVHEMVYALVPPLDAGLIFDPTHHLTISLADRASSESLSDDALLTGDGLRGDYFTDAEFRSRRVTRVDAGIQSNWGGGAPVAGLPNDQFSIRWTGSIVPQKSATYTFHLAADDRAELWIDGKHVVAAAGAKVKTGTVKLDRGRRHAIRVEFVEGTGPSSCHVWWSAPGMARQAVPRQFLRPEGPWVSEFPKGIPAQLVPPIGSKRPVLFEQINGRPVVRIDGATLPGLHRILLQNSMADSLRHMRVGDSLAFVVRGRPEESELKVLSESDIDSARKHKIDLFAARSSDDLVRTITGGIPGQRLWKHLAVAALVVALLEIALARWIAVQRKTGAMRVVDFTSATDAVAYRSRAEAMLDTDSGKGK